MFHMFPVYRRHVYLLCQVKQARFALVVGIVMIVSGGALSSFQQDISYLFCLKAIVIQVFFFFCTRNEYYIMLSFVFCACICKHGRGMHNNTVCKFNYRRHLMISAIRCGGKKKIYIYMGIGMDFQPNE